MNALTEVGVTAGALVQAPRVERSEPRPRVVEPADQSRLENARQELMGSGDAVLELLERSAEAFSELLTTLEDAAAAGAMTGFNAAGDDSLGRVVDTRA